MTGRFGPIRSAVLLVLLVSVAVTMPRTLRAQAGQHWYAFVGAQNHDKGHQALAFLPNEIWIHAGDTITWRFEVDEIHTVTFLKNGQMRPPFPNGCTFPPAPPSFSATPASFDGTACVTTPPLVKGDEFTIDFPNAGNFKVVCLVHPNMTGVIHVLPVGQQLPHDQHFYNAQAFDQAEDILSDTDRDDDHRFHKGHGSHHAQHTVIAGTGEISATPGGSSTLSIMRFDHSPIVIHAGETVEFVNDDPVTPHTITFGTEPADPMPPVNTTTDADGARHAVINSTSDSAHSGFIVAAPQDRIGLPQAPVAPAPGAAPTRFRVTFPHAGTFPYICALHDDIGMKGTVIVLH